MQTALLIFLVIILCFGGAILYSAARIERLLQYVGIDQDESMSSDMSSDATIHLAIAKLEEKKRLLDRQALSIIRLLHSKELVTDGFCMNIGAIVSSGEISLTYLNYQLPSYERQPVTVGLSLPWVRDRSFLKKIDSNKIVKKISEYEKSVSKFKKYWDYAHRLNQF